MTAEEFYQKGNEYRRKGDWKHAIDCYLEAIERDPELSGSRSQEDAR